MDALLKKPRDTLTRLNKDGFIKLGGGEHSLRYNQSTGEVTLLMDGRSVGLEMMIEKKAKLRFLISNPYLAKKYGNEKMDKYTFYLENHQIDINNWPKNIIPSLYQTGRALVLYNTITKETLILNEDKIKNKQAFYSSFLYSVKRSLKKIGKLDNFKVLKTISDLCNKKLKSSFQNTICDIWHPYYHYPNYCVWKPINSNKDIDITVDFYNGNPRLVL